MTDINYSTVILFAQPDKVRAVKTVYYPEKDEDGNIITTPHRNEAGNIEYNHRKIHKTLDQDLAVDDYVIVPTQSRHKMTVARVVEVDVDDYSTTEEVGWIIGRFDPAPYKSVLRDEAKLIATMKKAEKRHAREEMKTKMFAYLNEEEQKRLAISSSSTTTAASAPVVDGTTS